MLLEGSRVLSTQIKAAFVILSLKFLFLFYTLNLALYGQPQTGQASHKTSETDSPGRKSFCVFYMINTRVLKVPSKKLSKQIFTKNVRTHIVDTFYFSK